VLRALGRRLQFLHGLRLVLVGLFFNQVLPSNVGGDAVRIWQVRRDGVDLRTAVDSVVIDRLMALGILFLIIAVSLPALFTIIPSPVARGAIVLLAGGGLVGYVLFAFLDRLPDFFFRWRATKAIAALSADFRTAISSPRYGATALALSLLIQLVSALSVFVLAASLEYHVSLIDCVILMPPVILATAIPISIAGWGVREGAMVVAFGYVGLSAHDALALSVLFGAAMVCASLPGGLVWIASGGRRPPPDVAEEGVGA
ncbi:MAG: lysylphosphatidylglycerol synthase transmembrane domain-containing protein, partial [Alphaproteobacteria bacterium]|nr:lysylphosphatidylglycerol synthase transmembrane domain-containing protein [Alphaproteobacteria bacterium]